MKKKAIYKIQNIPAEDRPREKLLRNGPESMSTAELIALILGSGTKGLSVIQLSVDIVSHFGTLEKVSEASVEELCQIKGLGPAKAIQLKAALCLGMRATKGSQETRYRIQNPAHAYHLIRDQLESEKREHFIVILQDTKGYLINHHIVSIGTLSRSLVHPREVFYPAIRHKAASIILAHNHPSGDPEPSPEDIETTKHLVHVGEMLGIPVNDHIIIGRGCFISIRQAGLLPF